VLPNRQHASPLSLTTANRPWRIDVALYSVLFFATAAFARNFAWIHIRVDSSWPYVQFFFRPTTGPFAQSIPSGLPIFVTELFLALLLVCSVVRRRTYGRVTASAWLDGSLLLWLLVGLYDLARGLSVGPTLALRDSAIVYYASFVYIARTVCDSWKNIAIVCLAFWLGTVASLSTATLEYAGLDVLPDIDWPTRGQFLSGIFGLYFLVAILTGMTLWPRLGRMAKWILAIYLSFATFALVLPQQRSLVIAFVVGLSMLLVGRSAAAVEVFPLWRMAVGVAAAALILETTRFFTGSPSQFLGPVQQLIAKTRQTVVVATPSGDDRGTASAGAAASSAVGADGVEALQFTSTARFRQDAWAEAWARVTDHPMFGEGFGKPFVFYDSVQRRWWTDDVRPHNAYLTILYKMGLLGLAAFALVHLAFYTAAYGAWRSGRSPVIRSCIFGLMTALLGMQVYGFFNLLFESPFLAVVYWSVMGLILSLIHLEGDAAAPISDWTPRPRLPHQLGADRRPHTGPPS
jgi:O-Antigen ligase